VLTVLSLLAVVAVPAALRAVAAPSLGIAVRTAAVPFAGSHRIALASGPRARRAGALLASIVVAYLAVGLVNGITVAWRGAATGVVRVRVSSVLPDGPAAGVLQAGDVVLAVDDLPVYLRDADGGRALLGERLQDTGDTAQVTVRRGATERRLAIAPVADPVSGQRRLGIAIGAEEEWHPAGAADVAGAVILAPLETLAALTGGMVDAVTGRVEGEVMGPVGMAEAILDRDADRRVALVMGMNLWLLLAGNDLVALVRALRRRQ
jgi:hypothetical protein